MHNTNKNMPVLKIDSLTVNFTVNKASCHAVNKLSLEVYPGEMVAVVGESGCGKTLTALSAMGLLPPSAQVTGGQVMLGEKNILCQNEKEWNHCRGQDISMIFQEPMTALNPLLKVGKQISEAVKMHHKTSWSNAKNTALSMIGKVGLADTERVYNSYPHQLSGGMRQRIMIAMALVNNPAVILADEPTTALDVTIQAQIMDILHELNQKTGTAVLLISHDLGLVSHLCNRVYIMYAGEIIESGPVDDVIANPMHPYTKGLLASIPSANKKGQTLTTIPGSVPAIPARNYEQCLFYSRCANRCEACLTAPPMLMHGKHAAKCHNIQIDEKRGNI